MRARNAPQMRPRGRFSTGGGDLLGTVETVICRRVGGYLAGQSNRSNQIDPDRRKGLRPIDHLASSSTARIGPAENGGRSAQASVTLVGVVEVACPSCGTPADVTLGPSGLVREREAEPLADGSVGICAGCGSACVWDRGGCALRLADRSEVAALAPRTARGLAAAQKIAATTAHLSR